MAKGAKQKSNVILLASGSKHARPFEPVMKSQIQGPPDYFRGEALKMWNRIVPELSEMGIIYEVDRPAMEALCLSYQRLREAQEAIDEHGVVIDDPMKGLIKNPACTVATAENNTIARLSAEFGLTSASRGKVTAPPKAKTNKFSEI